MRISSSTLSLLLCLPVIVSLPAGADWSGTHADQAISFDDNEYARAVQIAYSEASWTVHAFWSEDAPSVRELHYGRSTDDGQTWSSTTADRIISFPDGNDVSEECDVAEAHGGILVVVWSEDLEAAREVHFGVSGDDGLSWSSESADLIASDPSSAADTGVPSITRDLGVFHVVWNQVTPGGVSEIHYSRSPDNGATWTGSAADRVISFPDGNPALTPKIIACEHRLFVVWRENDGAGEPRIHLGLSDDNGDTWTSETEDREISPPASLITDLAVSAARTDLSGMGIHAIYRATYDIAAPFYYEIYVTSSFDGTTWSGESQLTPISHDEGAGRSASNPDIFVGQTMGPLAVWDEEEDVSGTKEQHFSWFNGDTWSGATADSVISFPDGEDGYRPSITGTNWVTRRPDGRRQMPAAWVAWTEFSGGSPDNYEVHLSTLRVSAGDVVDQPETPGWAVRPAPNPSFGVMRFEFALPEEAVVTVAVYDPQGRLVRALARRLHSGAGNLRWDGTDAGGQRVSPGHYIAQIRSEATRCTLPLIRF